MSSYRELGPDRLPAVLRGLVECAWRAEIPAGAPGAHRQRVLPDGCMDLLLSGGRIVVAGPDTAAHVADQAPGSVTTGLRFRTGALPALLGVPAAALRDRRTDLADVAGPARRARLAGLADRAVVADPTGATGRALGRPGAAADGLGVLTGVVAVLRRAGDPRLASPLPHAALDRLAAGASVADVADELGCTTRTLHRRCLETAGYGPATLRRVLRFRAAAALLHAGAPPAEAAARAGYADQPHLSREVRALSGLSPTALSPVARAGGGPGR